MVGTVIIPEGKLKSERFNNFPKITQLADVGARVRKQTVWLQSLCVNLMQLAPVDRKETDIENKRLAQYHTANKDSSPDSLSPELHPSLLCTSFFLPA